MELDSYCSMNREPATPSPDTPPWWSAGQGNFARLLQLRNDICEHDAAVARTARNTLTGLLLGAVTIYSADAAGAVSLPLESGALAIVAALTCACAAVWAVNRRLAGQIGDTGLRTRLWLGLVDAARKGVIDANRLRTCDAPGSRAAELLRAEAATALRFVAARGTLAPYVPLFGDRFALRAMRRPPVNFHAQDL